MIRHSLTIVNNEYPNELAYIFTNCLNELRLVKIQIKHPMLHNNHPDKMILEEIVTLLQQQTQPTSLYKVRVHANIESNEQAHQLAKDGRDKDHQDANNPHKFAHSTPYYYQKDWWHSMEETPNKGPIRFLDKHFMYHDKRTKLEKIATQFSNVDKWIANEDIDNKLSNDF